MSRVRKKDRCGFPGCTARAVMLATLQRESGADYSQAQFCERHGDELLTGQLPAARHVDVWTESGEHDEMVDRDTAITRLQIVEGLSRRAARRKLERGR